MPKEKTTPVPSVSIDRCDLEREMIEAADKHLEATDLAAAADDKVTRLKHKRDVLKADISLKVRSEPDRYGVEKVTEGAIDAVILTDEEFQEHMDKLHKAMYEADQAAGLVDAFHTRKKMIEGLIQFQLAGFMAQPSGARQENTNKARERIREERTRSIRGARRRGDD